MQKVKNCNIKLLLINDILKKYKWQGKEEKILKIFMDNGDGEICPFLKFVYLIKLQFFQKSIYIFGTLRYNVFEFKVRKKFRLKYKNDETKNEETSEK